jgi:hypothetical protein
VWGGRAVPVWEGWGKLSDLGMEEKKETVHMSAVDFFSGEVPPILST